MKDVGGVYGLDTVVFFINESCEFFRDHVECQFCSVNYVARGLKLNDRTKTEGEITETLLAARQEGYEFVNFIGGSYRDHDYEFRLYLDIVRKCREATGTSVIEGAIISMPPEDFRILEEARGCGIRALKFNLEIFDETLFERYMPGKALYGRGRLLEALREAVRIWGEGNVYSNLLIGIEPVPSVVEGFKELASLGVVPVGKTFHPDLGTRMHNHGTFNPDQLLEAFRGLHEATRGTGLQPWLSPRSLRGSLAWEFKRGYLA